jgi:hypothetical protein
LPSEERLPEGQFRTAGEVLKKWLGGIR